MECAAKSLGSKGPDISVAFTVVQWTCRGALRAPESSPNHERWFPDNKLNHTGISRTSVVTVVRGGSAFREKRARSLPEIRGFMDNCSMLLDNKKVTAIP